MVVRFKYFEAIQDKAESFVKEETALSNTLSMAFPAAAGIAAQMAGSGVTLHSLFSL